MMSKFTTLLGKSARGLSLILAVASVAACSSPPASHPAGEPWDPYEDENRQNHEFNKDFDRHVLNPASRAYNAVVGDQVQLGIQNASDNFSLPGQVVNNVLQGNMRAATGDTYRFIINSTIGVFGLFDPATGLGLPEESDADFGQTLHVWGVREGSYVELPFFGPSTERDSVGIVVDFFTNPLDYLIPFPESLAETGAEGASILTERRQLSGIIDPLLYESADSYAQARSLYLQRRQFQLNGSTGDSFVDPYDDPNLFGPEGLLNETDTE